MQKRSWAMFVMGIWVAGSLLVSIVASQNFYTIDRLLASSPNPTFPAVVEKLGEPSAREFLRYLSSELNRLYFQLWNAAQLALGALVLWLTGQASSVSRIRWTVIGMLVSVLLMLCWLVPEITRLGRALDFVPRMPPPPELGRFGILHAGYAFLELAKLAAGLVVAAWIAGEPHR